MGGFGGVDALTLAGASRASLTAAHGEITFAPRAP